MKWSILRIQGMRFNGSKFCTTMRTLWTDLTSKWFTNVPQTKRQSDLFIPHRRNIKIMSVAPDSPPILPLLMNKLFSRLEESFTQKYQTECKSTPSHWQHMRPIANPNSQSLASWSLTHITFTRNRLFLIAHSFARRFTGIVWHFWKSPAFGPRTSRSESS